MNRSAPRGLLQSGCFTAWTRGLHRSPLASDPIRKTGFFAAFHIFAEIIISVSANLSSKNDHFPAFSCKFFRKTHSPAARHCPQWQHPTVPPFRGSLYFAQTAAPIIQTIMKTAKRINPVFIATPPFFCILFRITFYVSGICNTRIILHKISLVFFALL